MTDQIETCMVIKVPYVTAVQMSNTIKPAWMAMHAYTCMVACDMRMCMHAGHMPIKVGKLIMIKDWNI